MGRALGVGDASALSADIQLDYIDTLVTQKIFIAPSPCRVADIRGNVRVAGNDGGGASLKFYKAASGIAVGSGTLLNQGTFDLQGTADTNQILTLAPGLDTITLAAGDAIGYVLTGTATASLGTITIRMNPVIN